jgi:hypothetical protein
MTLEDQIKAMGADDELTPDALAAHVPEATLNAQPGTLGAQLEAGDDEEDFADFLPGQQANNAVNEFLETPTPQEDSADPYALLPAEERQLLEWAKSAVGSRFQREAAALVEQYGGEDALLQALDTPQVDEEAVSREVMNRLSPVLNATDEFGEAKYTLDDPLVQILAQQTAQNVRAETLATMTQQRQAQQSAQSRQEAQIQSLLTQYPNAEPNALRVAAQAGGNLTAAAQASHAHYTNLITQTQAAAINAGHVKPQTRINASAPAPLTPGGRAPELQGLKMPDPIRDPKGFERFRNLVVSGKIKL